MDNTLQVRLSADITALVSALTKAKATIKSFESETAKESEKGNVGFKRKIGLIEQLTNKAKALRVSLSQATNEKQVEQYNQALEDTSKELTRLNSLGRSVGGGFGQMAKQTSNASGVAIEFNRVIQDAPFGLIGIGNNLQQLAGNFSNLSKTAGGTGKALAATFTSLISPVNLGLLAISALTAGFTAYQMGAFDGILATEDVGKAAEDSAQKLDDYKNSLDAVTKANIEGASQAQGEIQSFKLLKAQIESANVPLTDKLEAVKELKNQYPEYLKGLTDEQILAGNVGDAYENLTKQIIASAKARAFSEAIAENSEKILLLEEQQIERTTKILEAREKFTKAGESIYDVGEIEIIKEINDLGQEQIDDVIEVNRLKKESERLEAEINQQIKEGARFTKDLKKETEDLKISLSNIFDEKDFVTQLEVIGKAVSQGLITPEQASLIKTNIAESLKNAENTAIQESIKLSLKDSFDKAISSFETVKVDDIPLSVSIKSEVTGTVIGDFIKQIQGQVASLDDFKTALKDAGITSEEFFAGLESGAFKGLEQYDGFISKFIETNKLIEDATKVLEQGIENTIGDVAFAIGDALANGGNVLEAGGAALLGGLAAILNQLGQLAIGAGIAIAGIKKALQTLNPVVAIAAGVALVALSGFVSAKARSLGSGGGGGNIIGGGGSVPSTQGAGSGRAPQIFTNAQAPSIPASSSPTPSGSIDFDRAQGRLTTTVTGEDISFVYDRYQERKKGGG